MQKELPPTTQNQSLNLLYTPEPLTNKSTKTIILLRLLILLIPILYVLLFFTVKMYVDKANKLKADLTKLENVVTSMRNTEETTREITKKIEIYENLLAQRKLLGTDLSFVLNNTPPEVKIESIKVGKTATSIKAKVQSPITFSLLLVKFLSNENISHIVLRSVVYESRSNEYAIDFDIGFK